MPRAALTTLGCKVNQFETDAMAGLFVKAGYEIVPFDEVADVYVINTCSVTTLGERKSRQLISRARRRNGRAVIAVTGCYAQLAPEKIKSLPGVSLVLGTNERKRIVELAMSAAKDEVISCVSPLTHDEVFEDIPLYSMPGRTRAFLKIQDGCENFCAFCVIPYARGHLRSRHPESVEREAKKLVDAGFREIVLTGIHLGAYGRDLGSVTLTDAARLVLKVPGLARLRMGSLESVELSEELFSLMREDARFARHLHLPLQSGSDRVLRLMRRHYDTEKFARLIGYVRENLPKVAISTDVIVGFPGETDECFMESLDFVRSMKFSRVHVFPYSRRPGTAAADMPDQIPPTVRRERVRQMMEVAGKMAKEFYASLVGGCADVIFETTSDGVSEGLTGNYVRVYTDAPVTFGEVLRMRLTCLYGDGVWGEMAAI